MPKPRLLLVGWDAADWKVINPLVERGEMPGVAQFIEQGVMADMQTLQPILSPMLWNSIATGKRADKHGILGFTEVDPQSGRVRPSMSTSRRVKAVWNIFTQLGYRTHIINWFAGHPAEPINGICISDAYARGFPPRSQPFPLVPGTVRPERLAKTFEDLRLRPEEVDSQLVRLFVPRAGEADLKKDRHLDSLVKIQAECISVHAAATWAIENEPWDFMAVYYPSIDHFSHAFMNFHPPKPDWVDQKAFDLYHDVLNSGYRLHDMMLRRLIHLAGPDTTVMLVSDHGFHSDHLRPRDIPAVPAGPAAQHRPLGIFLMQGPGVKKDERIYGVNLLDVAPTVLSVFGLPSGQDMEGRVLVEAFEQAPAVNRIPSWETVEGQAGMHKENAAVEPADAEALLEQFVALGYIDKPEENLEEARKNCLREQKWNLARVLMSCSRYVDALDLIEPIYDERPERGDYALALAECQWRLGLLEEAAATAESAIENYRETPGARLVLAKIAFERGRYHESLQHLDQAQAADPNVPEVHIQLGLAYLKLRMWGSAEKAFARTLEIDPHNAFACQGLAAAYLRQRQNRKAAEWALSAVGFQHDLALSHFYLGIALARLQQIPRAIQAFETTLAFQPPLRAAHRWLVRLYRQMPDSAEKIELHREAARSFLQRRKLWSERMAEIKRGAAERAAVRAKERAEHPPVPKQKQKQKRERRASSAEKGPGLEFTIVSGLPRSGTSLLMRMLETGGMPVMTDAQRQADIDNPEGYYEWEEIKKLPRNPEILRQAEGKAVKVISALLNALPRRHRYKVVFMDRPIEEVVASHQKMIANRKEQAPAMDPERMAQILSNHRTATLQMLKRSKGVDLLVVDYPELVRQPADSISKIVEFLGPGRMPRAEAMVSVIRPELHRNRSGNSIS